MKNKISDKKIIVMYHGDCSDGFGAAWSAWKKLGDSAQYFPVEPGFPPPEGLKEKDAIYMLDFTYPEEYLKPILRANKRVVGVDHHKTNAAVIGLASDHLFDLNHSGAVLSWAYFHPKKSIPRLLEYIEDVDLWRFKLKDTDSIFTYASIKKRDFEVWSSMAEDFEDPKTLLGYKDKGDVIIKYRDNLVEGIIKENSELVELDGHKTYAVNASHSFASLLGERLFKKDVHVVARWAYYDGHIHVSLRSDGTVDVSEIAEKFGGGGHKGSAGFRVALKCNFPWKAIK